MTNQGRGPLVEHIANNLIIAKLDGRLSAQAVSKRTKKIFRCEIYSINLQKQGELLMVTPTFDDNFDNYRLVISTSVGDFTF